MKEAKESGEKVSMILYHWYFYFFAVVFVIPKQAKLEDSIKNSLIPFAGWSVCFLVCVKNAMEGTTFTAFESLHWNLVHIINIKKGFQLTGE